MRALALFYRAKALTTNLKLFTPTYLVEVDTSTTLSDRIALATAINPLLNFIITLLI